VKRLGWLLLAWVGCAEAEPGIPPPSGQLYFPLGLVVADPSGTRPLVVIGSTNFDQRYNSGFVTVFGLAELAALAPTNNPGEVTYVDGFGTALVSQTRVLQLGGPLLHVPGAVSGLGEDRIYVAARAANRVQSLRLLADGTLDCSRDGDTRVSPTDCTEGAVLPTGFDDPFSLAYVPGLGPNGSVAVSHLGALVDGSNQLISALANIDVARWEQHIAGPALGSSDPGYPLALKDLVSGGFSGLTFVPGGLGGRTPALLATNIDGSGGLALATITAENVSETDGRSQLVSRDRLNLDTAASAQELRGLAVDGNQRAYVSVRFVEGTTTYNAGIAVIDLTGDLPRLISLVEVGNELAQPVLYSRGAARWLYVPDLRDDRIWVLDVRSDTPTVVAEIKGRDERTLNGETFQARVLAGPSDLAFTIVDNRILLLVNNFANSTLAVIDASSIDPREHRVIARLGRDLDGAGKTEGQQ
jgi:hypothetical protein